MINKKVRIKTKTIETDVLIVDRRLTNMAEFYKSAVMNNASFEVYIGLLSDELDVECPIIEFVPSDIIKIY